MNVCRTSAPSWSILGSFNNDDGDGKENVKSNRYIKQNNKLARATRFFTFLCRYCTTTTWKCLISLFMEDVNKRRRNFLSVFLNLSAVSKKSTPGKLLYIRHFRRIGIINATKFGKTLFHFKSDVFELFRCRRRRRCLNSLFIYRT